MSFEHEKRVARSILDAIEDAGVTPSQTFDRVRGADPALLHFIFAWLRARYPSSHPTSDGVLGRLTDLCTQHPKAAQMAKKGQSDPVVAWFEDGHSYRDYGASDFIDLVVDKLEG
jgi:hypothetical protein